MFSFILVEWSNSWAFHSSANIFFLIDKLNRHDNDSEIKKNHDTLSEACQKYCQDLSLSIYKV